MSVIEKSVQLGKDLFAINRKTTRELVAIQIGGVRRYVETNVSALRGATAIRSFPELAQAGKPYNTALIAGVQSDVLAGRDVVKGALQDTREVLSSVTDFAKKPARTRYTNYLLYLFLLHNFPGSNPGLILSLPRTCTPSTVQMCDYTTK